MTMTRAAQPMALVLALALPLMTGLACKRKPTETVAAAPAVVAPAKVAEVPREVTQMKANFERTYFDFDSSEVTDVTKTVLDSNVALMQKKADVKIEIQGHADERGTTDYNLALGQRRAQAVYNYMTARGVAPSRLKVVSYGEERPLATGETDTAWSKNRRAEFRITWGGDESVGGTTE